MDKYEASVWNLAPVTNAKTKAKLVASIQSGTATLAMLQSGGAVQVGLAPGDLAAAGCPVSGNGCIDVYAVSIAGVLPAGYVSWFQAAAAARNSLKRLPTNQEWQVAALGTPDTGGADNGSTTCDTDNLNFPTRCQSRDRAARASRTSAPSIWWGTPGNGWPSGCRGRRTLLAAGPPSATIGRFSWGPKQVVLPGHWSAAPADTTLHRRESSP
jgi:hypothetical protein